MPDAGTDFERQLREANTQLYAHSHDLAIRNKILSLLRKLYQISIQSVEPRELSSQIVETVRTELDLELVGILAYDEVGDTLTPIAFSESERFKGACAEGGCILATHVIEHASHAPLLTPVFAGTSASATDLAQLWHGILEDNILRRIAEDGHVRELLANPLQIGTQLQGVLILGFNRSVSELSQFERESIGNLVDVVAIALDRAHLYEELKLANQRQVTLIHFITHQIKGFVAKSRNIFSLALDGDFGPVSDQLRPMLQAGFDSDTQGVNTIQEILNASNIKSGKVTYKMEPFDAKALVDETVSALKPNAEKREVTLVVDTGSEPLMYTGDRSKLENAFRNLIDNAIKYTPKGTVNISLTKKDGKVVFTTVDTGVGITPEDMQNLFTEGGHGKDSTKVNVESTGFGLYIVKNIIEAHKGRVWAESEGAGKGSKFIVELPA